MLSILVPAVPFCCLRVLVLEDLSIWLFSKDLNPWHIIPRGV